MKNKNKIKNLQFFLDISKIWTTGFFLIQLEYGMNNLESKFQV